MILAALASLALSASPEEVSAAAAALASGDAHYARRAEGAHGGTADPIHVDRAIADYRRALALAPLSYEARLRLLRAFFFRGGFCDMDGREQVKLFEEAKKLAEDTVRLLDADVHRVHGHLRADAARTIAPAAETYLWAAVSWGQWAVFHKLYAAWQSAPPQDGPAAPPRPRGAGEPATPAKGPGGRLPAPRCSPAAGGRPYPPGRCIDPPRAKREEEPGGDRGGKDNGARAPADDGDRE